MNPSLTTALRLVADAGEKFFVAGVGGIHVAVEHQVLAAARSLSNGRPRWRALLRPPAR